MEHRFLDRDKELVLALIEEELRNIKLFQILEEIGVGDSFFRSRLDKAIFSLLELNSNDDQLLEFYVRTVDEEATRMVTSSKAIKKSSLLIYRRLCKRMARWTELSNEN